MCSVSKNILTLFLLAYETEMRGRKKKKKKAALSDGLLQVSWSRPLLLLLISERMGLAGLSEVINIRGHRVILIEWPPHCDAWEEPLLRHILQPAPPLSNLNQPPPNPPTPSLTPAASHASPLETLHWCWLFPPTGSKKTGLV